VKAKFGISEEKEARAVARAVQFKIAARGTQGQGMFQKGFEAAEEQGEEIILGRVARIIERLGL